VVRLRRADDEEGRERLASPDAASPYVVQAILTGRLEKYRPGAVVEGAGHAERKTVFNRGQPGGRMVPRATPGSSSA